MDCQTAREAFLDFNSPERPGVVEACEHLGTCVPCQDACKRILQDISHACEALPFLKEKAVGAKKTE